MNYTRKYTEQFGLFVPIGFALLWLWLGTHFAIFVGRTLATTIPGLAAAASGAIVVILGLGALQTYWHIDKHLTFLRRGFRMQCVMGCHWLYEERTSTGESRFLPCERVIIGKGYPAPCEVRITSASAWSSQAPSWAWNRREEILQRVALCFGSDIGGSVSFTDAAGT